MQICNILGINYKMGNEPQSTKYNFLSFVFAIYQKCIMCELDDHLEAICYFIQSDATLFFSKLENNFASKLFESEIHHNVI